MERKLAHIEEIINIQPIPNADRIEVATVLGWQCVVKKGEFKIGDKIIYVEVDSVMPSLPEYEFLKSKKYRIKTIKLKKQISQGLILPLPDNFNKKWKIGTDMTSYLKITKYLTPSEQKEIYNTKLEKNKLKKYMMRYSWFRRLFMTKNQTRGFPYWVTKTDEERIQNIPQVLEQFKDKFVYVTEKVDYQSGTWTSKQVPKFSGLLGKLLPYTKTLFVVASRNLQTNNKNDLYWKVAIKYNLENICKQYPGIIIQGEQGNTNIQKNKYLLKEPKMWIFNIIMPDGKFLNPIEIQTFCELHKLDFVPFIEKVPLNKCGTSIEEIVEYADGKSQINPKIRREGVVIRCIENGKKILSFKVLNPKFLLKYE